MITLLELLNVFNYGLTINDLGYSLIVLLYKLLSLLFVYRILINVVKNLFFNYYEHYFYLLDCKKLPKYFILLSHLDIYFLFANDYTLLIFSNNFKFSYDIFKFCIFTKNGFFNVFDLSNGGYSLESRDFRFVLLNEFLV